jgi:hypothetical protein
MTSLRLLPDRLAKLVRAHWRLAPHSLWEDLAQDAHVALLTARRRGLPERDLLRLADAMLKRRRRHNRPRLGGGARRQACSGGDRGDALDEFATREVDEGDDGASFPGEVEELPAPDGTWAALALAPLTARQAAVVEWKIMRNASDTVAARELGVSVKELQREFVAIKQILWHRMSCMDRDGILVRRYGMQSWKLAVQKLAAANEPMAVPIPHGW